MENQSPDHEQLTLSNVGEGKLEAQFQDAVAQAYEIFEELRAAGKNDRYEESAAGAIRCSIGMEVTLDLELESRSLTVGSRVSKFSAPKSRRICRTGFMRSGAVVVERAVQADLPLAPVRSLDDAGGSK